MSAKPPMLPPEPPKIPTFPNQKELHRSIATVFEELQQSVERNLGTTKQGVTCVPLLYFIAHLDDHPPDVNQEITFLRRPETFMELANITSKVLMRDPTFLSAITHAYADVMSNFFMGVGEMVKNAAPEAVPATETNDEEPVLADEPTPVDSPSNVLPFKKKTFMPEIN